MERIAFFDLEGPLSPQDNALEVVSLLERGREAFAVISRYDDLRALEGVEGYEPGDTLKLILPFLLLHGIRGEDVRAVSKNAALTAGAGELVAALLSDGWRLHVISTSYEQHALRISGELGIAGENVACTRLNLEELAERITGCDLGFVRETWEFLQRASEKRSLEEIADGALDERIGPTLDEFYWETIPCTELGPVFDDVQVLGGRRKVGALERFCHEAGTYLSEVAVVGDSITDAQMLRVVEAAGGLAVVFNGNRYALPYGTVGVASASLMNVLPVLHTWLDGGREPLRRAVLSSALQPQEGEAAYHWLVGSSDIDEVAEVHGAARKRARGLAAGSLG